MAPGWRGTQQLLTDLNTIHRFFKASVFMLHQLLFLMSREEHVNYVTEVFNPSGLAFIEDFVHISASTVTVSALNLFFFPPWKCIVAF